MISDLVTGLQGAIAASTEHGAEHAHMDVMLTFAGAVVLGVFFTVLAHKMRISSIIVLLLGGIVVGPQGFGLIDPGKLQMEGLTAIISLTVGIILFEGGLSLNISGYRQASKEIRGIVTIGVVTAWLGSMAAIKVFYPQFSWKLCMLFSSVILITGPSVAGPMLKRIRVKHKIHDILHWEGVLVDPIGVFIALLCYKIVQVSGDGEFGTAFLEFGQRIVTGAVVGIVGGFLLATAIRRKWIPEELMNVFVLASALAIFGIADMSLPETGLLSVTIAGFFVGYQDIPAVRKLRTYKAELIEMLMGLLFVLLAARLEFAKFAALGRQGFVVVVMVILVVRPAAIFLSTIGSSLKLKEKFFLCWIGPKGMIAASMASLFALNLVDSNRQAAEFMEAFTYSIIMVTVLFQGFTARNVGAALDVLEPQPTGWLIIGAHALARRAGDFIRNAGFHVVLLDQNPRLVTLAKRQGLSAVCTNPLSVDLEDHPELYNIGTVFAITEYADLNNRVLVRFRNEPGDHELYKWSPSEEEEKIKDADIIAGKQVWDVLQYNNLRALELDSGARFLETVSGPVAAIRHPERALLCLHQGRPSPLVPKDATGDCTVLMYQPFGVRLDLNIRPEWISYSTAESMPSLLGELLTCLNSAYPDLDVANVREHLMKQELEYSSLVGYDVSLPHFHLEELSESVVLIAKMQTPLKDLHSGDPIRYIFLVLSPSSQPKTHLNALSEISRFIMEEQNRERLDEVESLQDLRHLFFPEIPH